MQKIPSLFVRDFDNNPKLVTREYTPGTEWVVNGEGIPFRKWDGTACMITDGQLYKRYDAKNKKTPPDGFMPCQEPDLITGHWPGWVPVGPSDKWIIEAYENTMRVDPNSVFDGTYEAIGPKINANHDRHGDHWLKRHTCVRWVFIPVTFDGLMRWFTDNAIEGIVWHHSSGDGRMCKIKRSDFGLDWPVKIGDGEHFPAGFIPPMG